MLKGVVFSLVFFFLLMLEWQWWLCGKADKTVQLRLKLSISSQSTLHHSQVAPDGVHHQQHAIAQLEHQKHNI